MQVLVLGATGYVGSRLVPLLLAEGHDVVAGSSAPPAPDRYCWGSRVSWQRCDVTDAAAVRRAVAAVDAVVYLVHSLQDRRFAVRDRLGAEHVRDAVDGAGVHRLVYLSGLVPELPDGHRHSPHIGSRLEVERILAQARCDVLTLRAGVIIGAGSTSYEVIRHLASLLLVQPVPTWLDSLVQPVAVSDVLLALVAALADDAPTGDVDLGGPDVLGYPELLAAYGRAAGLVRLQVPALVAPMALSGLVTAALVGAPFWTVTALIESLRHSMVGRPERLWAPPDGVVLLGVEEALARAVAGAGDEGPLPSDAPWTRMRAPVLDEVRAPTVLRAGASLALRRLADLRTPWR